MKCRRAAFKATEILSIANNDVIQERNLQDISGQTRSPSQIATALESMVVFAMTDDARLSASSHKSFLKRIATAPKNKFAICRVNLSGDVLVAAGNALLRIAGCCYRRDKTKLSHHADVIAGRVVIGDFAVSELQPVNMIGLEVFSGRRNAY